MKRPVRGRALHRLVLLWALLCATASHAWADISDVIALVKPSVVIVGTFRATDAPRFRLRGTGFVVADGNLAITNAHVLPGTSENMTDATVVLQVRGTDGEFRMRQATVVEVDKTHDLALLRFEGAAVPALQIRNSDTVREGHPVAFMGFPIGGALGFSSVTHRGMVSSITQAVSPVPSARLLNESTIRGARAGTFSIFQLDGTAYPGNSGGPLFDPEKGDVLGVLNMVFLKGTRESALSQPSGISYAIPSRHVVQLIERAKGK